MLMIRLCRPSLPTVVSLVAALVIVPAAAHAQVPDGAERGIDTEDVLVSALAGATAALAGYHMAPTVASAIGLGEDNDGLQRGILIVIPVTQLLATITLN